MNHPCYYDGSSSRGGGSHWMHRLDCPLTDKCCSFTLGQLGQSSSCLHTLWKSSLRCLLIRVEFSFVTSRSLKCLMTSSKRVMAPFLLETPAIKMSINSPLKVSHHVLDDSRLNELAHQLYVNKCYDMITRHKVWFISNRSFSSIPRVASFCEESRHRRTERWTQYDSSRLKIVAQNNQKVTTQCC